MPFNDLGKWPKCMMSSKQKQRLEDKKWSKLWVLYEWSLGENDRHFLILLGFQRKSGCLLVCFFFFPVSPLSVFFSFLVPLFGVPTIKQSFFTHISRMFVFRTSVKVRGACPQHFFQLARESNVNNNVLYHAFWNFHMYAPDLLSFFLWNCQGLFFKSMA